jgi:hypothetical protein
VTPAVGAADGAERKLELAHQALLKTKGLQFDFKTVVQPKPPEWLDDFIRFLDGAAPILKFLFYGGLVLGAALIIWFVAREVLSLRLRRRAEPAAAADWRPEAAAARALLDEADALAAEGRFGEAVHLLLFRSIDDIAGRRPGLLRPALTSRDIAALDQMPGEARSAFARIAQAVERSFFGGRSVAADDFKRARGDYEVFAFSEGWS